MKSLINILAVIFAAGILLQSCDKVEKPYLRNDNGNGGNDTGLFVRKVLLEDYTGHKCDICPSAALVSDEIKNKHSDKLIRIAVHAGNLAEPESSGLYTADYTTGTGDELNNFFGIITSPAGLINRSGEGQERIFGYDKWDSVVETELTKSAEADIKIRNEYDKSTRTLSTTLEVKFANSTSDTIKICAFIIEDSIVSPQKNIDPLAGPIPDIEDFIHMDVLRGSLNGSWGNHVTNGSIEGGVTYTINLNDFQLDAGWKEGDCSVVAFAYQESTKEVIQAEEELITEETQFVRKVLLDDFTGHKCVNCPSAAKIGYELKDQHGEQLIIVAIHAGWFAEPSSSGLYTADYTTEVGDELNDFFEIVANPAGLVNRIGEGQERILNPDEWASAVGTELAKPAESDIKISNDYESGSRTLSTTLEVKFLNSTSEVYRICAFITEDSIVSPQMNNDPAVGPVPDIENYVHMHMLRGSLNGTWGDLVTDGSIEAGVTYTINLNDFQLDAGWKEGDCSVVAFVYLQSNQEIIQAEEEHVTD